MLPSAAPCLIFRSALAPRLRLCPTDLIGTQLVTFSRWLVGLSSKTALIVLTGVSIPVPFAEQLVSWPKFLFIISLWSPAVPCHQFSAQNRQRHVNSGRRCSSRMRGEETGCCSHTLPESRVTSLWGFRERVGHPDREGRGFLLWSHTLHVSLPAPAPRRSVLVVWKSHSGSRVSGPSLQGSHVANLRCCESALPRGSQIHITSEPAPRPRPDSHVTSGLPGVHRWVTER